MPGGYTYNTSWDASKYEPSKFKKPELKLFLECGNHPEAAFFEIDDGRVKDNQFFVLDRVHVDTSHLTKPLVKLEFSSIIFFEAEDEEGCEHEVEVDLLFKLIRSCGGYSECLQTWRYLYELDVEGCIDELEAEMSVPFVFTFCDTPCPNCCEYKVVVEGRDFEGEFDALRIVTPTLSALVQGYTTD